ncbi:TolC family protein [Ascidiimonas sp. W6]|uniref:TolC family protein n=1 Tax=Ascidiimonas meishanensis TaxID=3128903 RepID=UPI0030ECF489
MKRKSYINIMLVAFCSCASFMVQGQELEYFIKETLKNNPGIQAYQLKYDIANEYINETKALPNTEFGFGYFVSEPETRTGAQKARVSVKQMLPWFGTLTARENYAASLAETTYLELVILQRKLLLTVSQSYYKLYVLQEKSTVIKEKIALLKNYEELALVSLEVGKASAVDVLRLQIRQNELDAELETIERRYKTETAIFQELLNRKDSVTVVFPWALQLPETDHWVALDSISLHPELEKYEKLSASVEKSIQLNEKDANPNLGFGLDYIAVAERPNLNFSDNGKDILMPMISLSIPLFNSSYRSKLKQLNLKKKEIYSLKKQRSNLLASLLTSALEQQATARKQYHTQLKNLEHARDAEEILTKTYENGTIDFTDILDIQELQLAFQVKRLDAIESYFIASSKINYLTNY